MSGGKVRDVDQGYRALIDRVFAAGKPKVMVGIFEADGAREVAPGTALIDIAVWNEFGTDTIPARSFIRAWFDENIEVCRENLVKLVQGALIRGETDMTTALERFGLWMQGQIQVRIARGIPPENAPATVAKKGSSKPLIDTGQLRSSVTFAIDFGNGSIAVHEGAGG